MPAVATEGFDAMDTAARQPDAAPSAAPANAWVWVLIGGSVVIALSMGVRQVSGLFLRPVAAELGMSREAFGAAVALQNLVWGLAQPLAGMLADRFGGRVVALLGGLVYVAGLALAATTDSATMFTIGLGLLGGIGQAGTAFAVIFAVVGRVTPPAQRALALGLGSTAASVGIFVLVPVASALIDRLDWRGAMLATAAMLAAIPLLALMLREPPHKADASHASAGDALVATRSDRDFWLLNLGFATCGFQLAFISTYMPAMLTDRGLDAASGAIVLATIGASNIAGTWLCGVAGSRWAKSRVLAMVYVARAAAMVAFLACPLSLASAVAFGAAIGLMWTGTVPLTTGLVADMWGRRHLGFVFGLVYIGHQVGAFLGAWAGGFAFDRWGSFDPVWFFAVAASLFAAACHLVLVERPRAIALREQGA
jgi:predicted MFS family arabinose efflux permease